MRSLTVEKYTGKGRGPKLIPKTLQHIGIPWMKVNQQSTLKAMARERENQVNAKILEIQKKIASRKRNDQSCKMLLMGQDE